MEYRKKTSSLKFKRLKIDCSPVELFLKLSEQYEYTYLLESMRGPKKLAQFSFVGFMPKSVISVKDGEATLVDPEAGERRTFKTEDPLNTIGDILHIELDGDGFRFTGGAVGYISYDSIRYWESIPSIAIDDMLFPDIEMGVYDDGIIFDHINRRSLYFFRDEDRSREILELLKTKYEIGNLSYTNLRVNIDKGEYEEIVRRAKEYIEKGDIFQVVLSKRYSFKIKGDLSAFYLNLRRINPSPYMYFLRMGKRRIVGSSPEMLVRVDGKIVETFPIAGTRPKVDDPAETEALAEDLLKDPKERAEHVMLVDLARNDIGKVSKFGTVHVPEFMRIHQYSHVQHIVSRVVGELRDDCSSYDALRAVFPAGTVSGAPKIRAMEIIEESEPVRRGPYAGAVGYFSYNGNADFAITIRTLIADGDKCFIQAGGGIVADSNPEKEWFETEYKARALMRALELSEEEK